MIKTLICGFVMLLTLISTKAFGADVCVGDDNLQITIRNLNTEDPLQFGNTLLSNTFCDSPEVIITIGVVKVVDYDIAFTDYTQVYASGVAPDHVHVPGGHWYFVAWTAGQTELIKMNYPNYVDHRDSHAQMMHCWELRNSARYSGTYATCVNSEGWPSGYGRNVTMRLLGGPAEGIGFMGVGAKIIQVHEGSFDVIEDTYTIMVPSGDPAKSMMFLHEE
jgi:hypothetical protein